MALNINMDNIILSKENFDKYEKKLLKELENIKNLSNSYKEEYSSTQLLAYESKNLEDSLSLAKKYIDYNVFILIGIGGSNLASMAIIDAIKGLNHNYLNSKKIYYLDTTDADDLNDLLNILKKNHLKDKILVNIISKSGTTTETIANYFILKKELNFENISFVFTSDKNSKLWDFAIENKEDVLEIPAKIGGRFSVFSNVSLFPLAFMGINCKKLLEGARNILENLKSANFEENIPFKTAIAQYFHYKENKIALNHFFFSKRFENLGKWERQLIGESLGKEYNLNSKKINCGIIPLISIGSTDLHSMAQLYLGGPNNIFHVLIKIKNKKNFKISDKEIETLIPNLNKKSFSNIMDAIYEGTKGAFIEKKIPFYEISFEMLDEYEIGQFLQMKILEVIYLANLLNINPFGQDNVEDYKIITKKYLKSL